MNPPRATADDYIAFLVATPGEGTATEMAHCQPLAPDAPAHDAFTRLLNRLEPDPEALWRDVQPLLPASGILVFDDTVLDKPHAKHMGLVSWHWSGRHKRIVQGINLVTALWTDGDGLWPCDYRLVDKATTKDTKNDLMQAMLKAAQERGLKPRCVCFDSWYSGLENLKAVRSPGWIFLTQVRSNRRVNPDRTGNRSISECDIAATGTVVHLEGFGLVKAFRIVATDGDTGYWIRNDLAMDEAMRLGLAEQAWGHRGIPSRPEAAHRSRPLSNADGEGAAEPYWVRDPRVRAAGVASVSHGSELVRRQARDHPRSRPKLPRSTHLRTNLTANCVSPFVVIGRPIRRRKRGHW